MTTLDEVIGLIESIHTEALDILAAGSQAGIGNDRLIRYAKRLRDYGGGHTAVLTSLVDRVVQAEDANTAAKALFNLIAMLGTFRANRATTR